MKAIFKFLQGKKTNIIGFCGLVYAINTNNMDLILLSLGLLGVRDAIKKK